MCIARVGSTGVRVLTRIRSLSTESLWSSLMRCTAVKYCTASAFPLALLLCAFEVEEDDREKLPNLRLRVVGVVVGAVPVAEGG